MSATAEAPKQCMVALAGANRIRSARAQLKRDIRAGTATLRDVLENTPDCAATETVGEAMMWPRRVGPKRAARLLRYAGVSGTRKLGGLTDRERRSLVEQIRLAGVR